MNLVVVGHVDHGKSTVIGRLLADTHALPEGKLEQLREMCRRNAKPFEYAFLLDALKNERAQGITIDTARCFFETERRRYILLDAPGHIEFLKNMITGASRADAALLVIDAGEGICENSRRHGTILKMIGVTQVAVLVNKMDLVGYDQAAYEEICRGYAAFLQTIGLEAAAFLPVSAMEGDNIASHSPRTPWYEGPNVLEMLDRFRGGESDETKPLRILVQDVYKFTESGDDRRIVAGMCESGSLSAGDEVVFYPSGKRTRVKRLEEWFMTPSSERESRTVYRGKACGFTTETQIYIKRGEIACKVGEEPPVVGKAFRASLFWLGREPLVTGKKYELKSGTAKTTCRLTKLISVMDASTLEKRFSPEAANRNDVADATIVCDRPLAFDVGGSLPATGRFVLVDRYEISGGGIVTEALKEEEERERTEALQPLTEGERRRWLGQVPAYVRCEDEAYGKALERALFEEERVSFCAMGIAAEEAALLLRAGLIVISDGWMKRRGTGTDSGAEGRIYEVCGSLEKDVNEILLLTKLRLDGGSEAGLSWA